MNATPQNSRDALQALLDAHAQQAIKSKRRWRIIGTVGLVSALALFVLIPRGHDHDQHYLTETALIGDLQVTVSASGTLEPTTSVDVGSEMSGAVARVLVQENDPVKKGQLLAQLDLTKLNDAVMRSKAALASIRWN